MRPFSALAGLALMVLGAAALPAQPRPAATADASRLRALLEGANRGEAAPLGAALVAERDPHMRALLTAWLAALRLDYAGAGSPEVRRLATDTSRPQLRMAALALLSSMAFSRGDYAEAARLGAALGAGQRAAGDSAGAAGTEQARLLAAMLEREPRLALERGPVAGRTPARRDEAGLVRIDLAIDGLAQEAVFDTGANLSVLSASAARRLGVRRVGGEASVGNSVDTDVGVRLAIADRVEIAGNVLRNAVFLVIDDAQLTFPMPDGGSYAIPAILGFPEMQTLRRFTMTDSQFAVAPAARAAPAAASRNLIAWTNKLFVDTRVGGIAAPLHLDTGARRTHLDSLFATRHPRTVEGLPREERRTAGAGGAMTIQSARWSDVAIEIAGRSAQLDAVLVGLPDGSATRTSYFGVVGVDLLDRFASYTIDFGTMRLELGAPVATPLAR